MKEKKTYEQLGLICYNMREIHDIKLMKQNKGRFHIILHTQISTTRVAKIININISVF